MPMRSHLKIGLLAGALALGGSCAYAQDYNSAPNESVEVTAPRFRAEQTTLTGPLEKISLSSAVPFDDLDLRTRRGARELRLRVRETAQGVCAQLADAYPVYELSGTSCYKTALQNGLIRANAAISDARSYND